MTIFCLFSSYDYGIALVNCWRNWFIRMKISREMQEKTGQICRCIRKANQLTGRQAKNQKARHSRGLNPSKIK